MRILLIIFLILAVATICLNKSYAQKKPVYTPAYELTIIGKLKEGNKNYHRIDTSAYPALPANIKRLLTNSAGMAVSFTTDSRTISAKWCVSKARQLQNMTPIANKGLDLYIKKNGKWQFAGVGRPAEQCSESVIVKNMESGKKECLLYLPLYDETQSLEIGTDADAQITPGANPFNKRILIYGSSIVQGASASRPGMAYPARLSRETGLHFINFGLSGSAKMEKPVADLVAELPAEAYVLDCVPNPSPEEITERTAYLINTIRANHPKAPIIVIQSIIRESGYFDEVVGNRVKQQNENIKKEVDILLKKGVKDLYFISAEGLLGSDHDGTTDGTHPNDIGFDRMLQKFNPAITAILRKYRIL